MNQSTGARCAAAYALIPMGMLSMGSLRLYTAEKANLVNVSKQIWYATVVASCCKQVMVSICECLDGLVYMHGVNPQCQCWAHHKPDDQFYLLHVRTLCACWRTHLCVSFNALLTSLYTSSTLLVTSKGHLWAQTMPTIVDPHCTSLKGARHCMSQVQVIGKNSSNKSILSCVSTFYHLSTYQQKSKPSYGTCRRNLHASAPSQQRPKYCN